MLSNHLIEYNYEGRTYSVLIPAESFEEATGRARCIGSNGRVIGSNATEFPATAVNGIFVRLRCWIGNMFAGKGAGE